MTLRILPLILLALLFPDARLLSEEPDEGTPEWVAGRFTKYEHRIPMRDGVRLYTTVFLPKDDSEPWPIVLTRTPYDLKPYGVDRFPRFDGSTLGLAKAGYIIVIQDVRGRNGSEGEFDEMRPYRIGKKDPMETDESSDAWDTIDWLVKNVPNNNGRVGVFGVSYPGFYTSMAMIDSHPALKAASPQAPIADLFMGDDVCHNGAFFLAANFGFSHYFDQKLENPLREDPRSFDFGTPDGYEFFLSLGSLSNADRLYFKGQMKTWSQSLEHPTYDDFWKARNIRPHLQSIGCAVMTVGGWYDAEDLAGTLETYRWTERQNPGITNLLVMGPWVHGGWSYGEGDRLGSVLFHSKTGEYYREQIEQKFFKHFLKGSEDFAATEAQVFETGTDRWRRFEAWPPHDAVPRTFYFHPAGSLSPERPGEAVEAFDEYESDPSRPVPHTTRITTGYDSTYMVGDQRFAARRPDVLVYQTEVLEEDLTVAGPIHVELNVSTTGQDADFVVKVIDVYPGDFPDPESNSDVVKMGGYQRLIRGEPFRGRFRNSFEKPEPFEPGVVARIEFEMPDICHTFRRGHRVMVQVQSSWFPLVDRNPQTYVNIPNAPEDAFRKARHRVYRSGETPSLITLLVLR